MPFDGSNMFDSQFPSGPKAQPAPMSRPAGFWARLRNRLFRFWDIARQRRELAALSDHLLADVGISRDEAVREAERPFWDDAGAGSHRNADRHVFGYRFHGQMARLLGRRR